MRSDVRGHSDGECRVGESQSEITVRKMAAKQNPKEWELNLDCS